jgi:hypothetical protein
MSTVKPHGETEAKRVVLLFMPFGISRQNRSQTRGLAFYMPFGIELREAFAAKPKPNAWSCLFISPFSSPEA